jgi:hypothetical protein
MMMRLLAVPGRSQFSIGEFLLFLSLSVGPDNPAPARLKQNQEVKYGRMDLQRLSA